MRPIVRASLRAGRHTDTVVPRRSASRSGGNWRCQKVLARYQDRAVGDMAAGSGIFALRGARSEVG